MRRGAMYVDVLVQLLRVIRATVDCSADRQRCSILRHSLL